MMVATTMHDDGYGNDDKNGDHLYDVDDIGDVDNDV